MRIRLILAMFFATSALSSYELSVLAMFRDESKYLKEWIDYHRVVGVEHFWLYNDHSVDHWQEVLAPYIEAGIVDLIDWTEGGDGYNWNRQPAIYRDGIEKAKGNTKWLAIIDLDEFILPMREQTITECLNKHYSNASAIYINWRHFGTGKVTVPEGESMLYHLTSCSFKSHPRNWVGKCIVRPEAVLLANLWTPHNYDLEPSAKFFDGNGELIPPKKGVQYDFNGKYCEKFLRINHYFMRDEYFFWNFRYQRMGDKELVLEQYEAYNLLRDFSIHRFVKKMYPEYFTQIK